MAHTRYPNDIKALTSLRFLAALLIVVFHLFLLSQSINPLVAGLRETGHMSVDFFFVLSGFILMHVYSEKLQSRAISFVEFFGRRLARVYPLHFATFAAALALWALGFGHGPFHSPGADFSWATFFAHLSATHSLFGTDLMLKFNMPSWTISSELVAYSLFPVLCPLVASRGLSPVVCLAIATITLVLAWVATSVALKIEFTHVQVPYRVLTEFVLGMALYRFLVNQRIRARPRFYSAFAALLIVAILTLSLLGMPTWLLFCFYTCLLIAAAESSRDAGESWLTHPVLVYLGNASYAVYLVHYVALTLLLGIWPIAHDGVLAGSFELFGGVYLLFVMVLAVAAHHLVEIPARRSGVALLTKTRLSRLQEAQSP